MLEFITGKNKDMGIYCGKKKVTYFPFNENFSSGEMQDLLERVFKLGYERGAAKTIDHLADYMKRVESNDIYEEDWNSGEDL